MLKGLSTMQKISVHLEESKGTISKHIYGHFAEHLGRGIYEGIWVGAGSSVPNTDGLRDDVIAALKKIRIPVLRWPGGCFADEYHWKDGIGPANQRKRMVNSHWGGVVEDNSFGTHEFFRLCELLDCDAYVSGNVGSGSVQEMQEWLQYMAGSAESPAGSLRARNGHQNPWHVRFFGVGNEPWGCGGNMRAEYYADVYRQYQTYVRQYQPDFPTLKIAAGAHNNDYQWTEVLMRLAGRWMDGISLHYYTVPGTWQHKGSATDFGTAEWFATLKKALVMEEWISGHEAVIDRYDPDHRVGLVVDEWGTWHDVEPGTNPGFLYQQNTLRDALVASVTLNIFNNHCDRVMMANLAQTVNVLQALLLTRGSELITTPTYHVFDLYSVHQQNSQVNVTVDSDPYTVGDSAIPQLSASASRDSSGTLHISICNLHHDREAPVVIDFQGELGTFSISDVSGSILSGESMNSRNTFDAQNTVAIKRFDHFRLDDGRLQATLPAKSVVQLAVR